MGFIRYRATRSVHLGQIRRQLTTGMFVEYDGHTTRLNGVQYEIPNMDEIIAAGWLVVEEEPTALVVSEPTVLATPVPTHELAPVDPATLIQVRAVQRPNHEEKALPSQELDIKGERIAYASPEARRASGHRPMANQQHVWESGPTAWLNSDDGPTCKVCGVTKITNLIRVDRKRGDRSQQHHYRDAHGNTVTSLEELSCPIYIGDPGSAAAVAKEHVRRVRGRVDEVEDRMEGVDARLSRLEAENAHLRRALEERPVLDADLVAEALLRLAAQAKEAAQLETIQVRGEVVSLPGPVIDAMEGLAEREKVPVRVQRDEDEQD